jgi:hypothetical protein
VSSAGLAPDTPTAPTTRPLTTTGTLPFQDTVQRHRQPCYPTAVDHVLEHLRLAAAKGCRARFPDRDGYGNGRRIIHALKCERMSAIVDHGNADSEFATLRMRTCASHHAGYFDRRQQVLLLRHWTALMGQWRMGETNGHQ